MSSTVYAHGTAPWETDPRGWDVNLQTGTAVHNDWRDALVPAAVGSIFGYGALGALGGSAASGSTAAGTGSGGGMQFGLGSLAKFFNSPGGTALVNAGTNLAGGAMQAHAQGKAANVQAQYAQQALDFAKQQYADAIKNFAPYMQASQGATAKLTDFLTQSRPPSLGQPTPTSGTPGMPLGALAQGGGQAVTLQAPTGETRQFSSSDPRVAHFLQQPGVQRVG